MRLLCLLLSALALGPWACAKRTAVPPADAKLGHFHTEPLGAQADAQRRPSDSDYAAKVRAALTERQADAQGCFEKTGGARRPLSVMVSSPFYVSPGAMYFPRHATSRFMAAYERCLLQALERWPLPRPVEHYEGVWLRVHFAPAEASSQDASTHSLLFEHAGTRVLLEVTQEDPYARLETTPAPAATAPPATAFEPNLMTRPQLLGGTPIVYSPQALALRVQGVMLVRCVITTLGSIENCRIVKPLPYMERPVLTSLYSNRYTPVRYKGEAMQVDYTFTVHFKLPE